MNRDLPATKPAPNGIGPASHGIGPVSHGIGPALHGTGRPVLLEVTNARAAYATPGGKMVEAVSNVNLELRDGEILGIAGESGCGKSTLAAVMAAAVRPPLRVLAGQLNVQGQVFDLTRQATLPQALRGALVSILPQGALNSLNPTRRVSDLAFEVLRAHDPRMTRKAARERAATRLETLGLPLRALDAYPHQLSGGMKQRVVAVISTLLNPAVLIADEPTSALDVSSQAALAALLQDMLARKVIRGIIFITHDLPLLRTIATRIAIMYAGQVVELGGADALVDDSAHPYTAALLGSILVPEPRMRAGRVEGIPGAPPDLRNPPSGCRFHPRCTRVVETCRQMTPPLSTQVGAGKDPERQAACWRPLTEPDTSPAAGIEAGALLAGGPL